MYSELRFPGLTELLDRYHGLALLPTRGDGTVIAGELEFTATDAIGDHAVTETFMIELLVPAKYPRLVPAVREIAGRIPRSFHTNPDSTLCLGSPLRILIRMNARPSLIGFVEGCVVPFLYGFVRHERGEGLPFGDLTHGIPGLLDDYKSLLGVTDDYSCVGMVRMLGLKRRVANKQLCPCGSGARLGRCHHRRLNRLRSLAPRAWFQKEAAELARGLSTVSATPRRP
jgi:hypothetical protein